MDIIQVAAGSYHTAGVRSDGTVVAAGDNGYGECNVGDWTNVIQVAAGCYHTVGLKTGGTVVAAGDNGYGECNVGDWTNIIQVAAGCYHTVGLKSNRTVVAVGDNGYGQCNVGGWTDIVQVAAGWHHTVGLKSDGTTVAVGVENPPYERDYGQCDVSGWRSITQVAAGWYHTVGLKSNRTLVAVGDNGLGQCNVGNWTNMIQIAAGGSHTVGLRSDGTVVVVDPPTELARWNLQLAVPPSRCVEVPPVPEDFNCGGGVCFIATAAYGTPMAEEIQILRQFRDVYLLTNTLGQALVRLHYRVSPPIAEFITEHPSLKPIVRAALLPAVAISIVAVNTGPTEKMAILGLLVLVSVALVVWAARRRGRGSEYT
jgi:alpha-tubulin suppressor-like RCC1 family protein